MSDRAVVKCRYGEVELKRFQEFHAAGDKYEIAQFDSEFIACRDSSGRLSWFDPSFVAERSKEENQVRA